MSDLEKTKAEIKMMTEIAEGILRVYEMNNTPKGMSRFQEGRLSVLRQLEEFITDLKQ